MMISRLILSLREATDRSVVTSGRVSEDLVFGPNSGLPQTQTHLELFDFASRATSASSGAQWVKSRSTTSPSLIPLLSDLIYPPTGGPHVSGALVGNPRERSETDF